MVRVNLSCECVWPRLILQVLHICRALTQGSTRLMKTGSKYIYTSDMRVELWIMTAWLPNNTLWLTCLTHSSTVCLAACSSAHFSPMSCTHLLVSVLLLVCFQLYCCALLFSYVPPQPDSLSFLFSPPHHQLPPFFVFYLLLAFFIFYLH